MEPQCGKQYYCHSSQAENMKIRNQIFVNKMELLLPTILLCGQKHTWV